MLGKPRTLPTPAEALPGRPDPLPVPERHFVSGARIVPPFPEGHEVADLGLGCFWGAERAFWELPGVFATAVGYQGGLTPNPTYREVCTGRTGHAEVVRVVFDPRRLKDRAPCPPAKARRRASRRPTRRSPDAPHLSSSTADMR